MPLLGAEEHHVAPATGTIHTLPTEHYWDGEGLLVEGFREPLGLRGQAWDIYLLYGPDAVWEDDRLPMPRLWMHQLGDDAPGAPLDRSRFADAAERLLGRTPLAMRRRPESLASDLNGALARDAHYFPASQRAELLLDPRHQLLQRRRSVVRRSQHEDPEVDPRQVLLIGKLLVAGNEGVEAVLADQAKEIPVLRSAPAAALCGLDLVL